MIEARNRTRFLKALVVEKRGRALSIPESPQDQAQITPGADVSCLRHNRLGQAPAYRIVVGALARPHYGS